MKKFVIFLVACLAAQNAVAQQRTFSSSEGHQYAHQLNEHGAVLTSEFPVTRFVGKGALSRSITQIEVLYLGKSCDAFSEILGEGTWSWANGGVFVEFDTRRVEFWRQEIPVSSVIADCRQ